MTLVQTEPKRRSTTNEIKRDTEHKQEGEDAAQLLPNESHATANVSLLAHCQKLPTAALNSYFHFLDSICD